MLRKICSLLAAGVLVSSAMVAAAEADGHGNRMNWSGIYAGLHAGGAWGDSDESNHTLNAVPLLGGFGQLHSHADLDGFLGGGHLGYNHQIGNIVFGAEVSYSGGNIEGSSGPSDLTNDFLDDQNTDTLKSLFQAVVRLGYGFDKALIYSKIGYAKAEVQNFTVDQSNSGTVPLGDFGRSEKHHSGLVLGAGLEYAFTSNLIFGIDYSYINLSTETRRQPILSAAGVPRGVVFAWDMNPDIHAVTARLSYKFGHRSRAQSYK